MGDEVVRKLRGYVVEEFLFGDDEGLADDTNLLRLGVIDSMAMVALTGWMEQEFGTKLQSADIHAENFATLEAMARLVRAMGSGT